MEKVLDMQFIRYMNLFSRVTRVSAKFCFPYNNMIVYIIPRNSIEQAIGRDNSNLRKLSNILGKRIRVVGEPKGKEHRDIQEFISTLVSPTQFQSLELKRGEKGEEIIITAGGLENKSLLIGRQRAREKELKEIIEQYFGVKELKIL